jgi:hypothetical protein
VVGIYETVFSVLSGDTSLQSTLGGSATNRKIFPIHHRQKESSPAIRVAVLSTSSDVGHRIERPIVDFLIDSGAGVTELNAISKRLDELMNRQRLGLGNPKTVFHLCQKIFERDSWEPISNQYRRIVRYSLTVTN